MYIFQSFTWCQHSCIFSYLIVYMMYLTVFLKIAIKKYVCKFKRIISVNWSKAVILKLHISLFEQKLDLEKFSCVIWAFSNFFWRLWSLPTEKLVLHTFYIFPIYVWFHVFFGLYWQRNFATRGNRTKGVKPLVSRQNFVQLLLPIRKK